MQQILDILSTLKEGEQEIPYYVLGRIKLLPMQYDLIVQPYLTECRRRGYDVSFEDDPVKMCQIIRIKKIK